MEVLDSGYTYSNRQVNIVFNRLSKVNIASSAVLLDEDRHGSFPPFVSDDFIEWEQPQSYMTHTTIRFPYGVMILDNEESGDFVATGKLCFYLMSKRHP